MPDILPNLDPKEVSFKDQMGRERKFTIHKMPSTVAREVVAQYPLSALPRVGDYGVNAQMMLRLMCYVTVKLGDQDKPFIQALTTRELIDQHTGDWETLAQLEMAMIDHNCSFFFKGKVLNSFQLWSEKIPELVTKILTDSLQRSSLPVKPPSEN